MASTDNGVQVLARDHPEWKPWLTVIEEVLREAADPKWEVFVPARPATETGSVPILSGATLTVEMGVIVHWFKRLMRVAYQSGAPKMSSLNTAHYDHLDFFSFFESSLCQNRSRLRDTAAAVGVEAEPFETVAVLVPVPFLYACNRLLAQFSPKGWTEGYCPVCGAWPALAEVRGIERSRYLRCGRCGGEWQAHCLFCPYCGMTDHEQLSSLVPEKSGSTRAVEVCKRCLGYIKTFTTLQGSSPSKIILDDLASVELDVAALEQGYKRPDGSGYALDVTIVNKPNLSERIFSWRA
jgi:FdhE protein